MPPRTPGTDAFVRIYNNDGSEAGACGNGMRCVADLLFKETGKDALTFETAGRAAQLLEGRRAAGLHRRHGRAALCAGTRSRWPRNSATRARSSCRSGRSTSRSCIRPRSVNMGNPHAIFWVDDVDAYDLGKIGPMLENHPMFPERANISLARGDVARPHRAAHLGARRRPDQGLRLGRLRGGGGGGAAAAHRPQGDGDAAGRRPR